MRIDRFKGLLVDRIRAAGHPAVSSVELRGSQDHENPTVRCSDGTEIRLMVVGSSPPGGDDRTKPEKIVERAPEATITVTGRSE